MDFTPMKWEDFFDRKELLELEGGDKFNVYLKGDSGPLFYLLHGGGYTGLSWSCFAEHLTSNIQCQILAPDLREHGETIVFDKQDMSANRLISDIRAIYFQLYGDREKPPPVILIGHSMGGALAIRIASSNCLPNILVVSAIDVVEGSAMASLNVMQQFLRNRPQSFASEEKAIEWCVKNRVTSNLRAARISMPSRLRLSFEGEPNGQRKIFRWRTNLFCTESYWRGWFQGLSKLFLQCEPVKVLILANVDRLDRELLTGQMKGQFQCEVLHKVGHAVHEDNPEMVAKIFIQIYNRYKVIFNSSFEK